MHACCTYGLSLLPDFDARNKRSRADFEAFLTCVTQFRGEEGAVSRMATEFGVLGDVYDSSTRGGDVRRVDILHMRDSRFLERVIDAAGM